ncbi:hypothetical protein M514_04682 [Trichuris suis]|uniref:Transmembrane protein n=1 Tax=Trichuris suis TaxID=68888 RepID=A0A085MBD9_9BILA|nr:hypothetical protein M513_04682 [Trichuris suis]KFD64122.1 hypothetical protein M514_04682 [Trichuris suis]
MKKGEKTDASFFFLSWCRSVPCLSHFVLRLFLRRKRWEVGLLCWLFVFASSFSVITLRNHLLGLHK